MTRATDVSGSHVNPTGTTCGEPSGRSVVNVARWRTDRNSRAAEDMSRGRVATGSDYETPCQAGLGRVPLKPSGLLGSVAPCACPRPTVVKTFWLLVRAGYRRHSTYRLALLAGMTTNSVFGFIRASILLAALASAGTAIG